MLTGFKATASRLSWPVLAFALSSTPVHGALQVIDKIAAIVEDDVVMVSELDLRVEQIRFNLSNQGRPMPPPGELREAILNQIILESLQLQMGQRAGVRIPDARLNESMATIAAQNGMDLDAFRDKLASQGLSYTSTREQVRREMTLQQVQQGNIRDRVKITEQDVNKFLLTPEGQKITSPQYHISHILLPLDNIETPAQEIAQKKWLETAARDIQGGTSLLSWLDTYNRSASLPLRGGDLGWRQADDLPAIFAKVVPPLNPGDVAGPLSSPGGLHLVQLIERRGGQQIIDQTHARHILVKPSEIRSDRQCETLLLSLRQRALAGEDFGDLARQYTEDIASAQEGGDLGWARKGQFVPAFEETMANTKVGQISEPFRSQFGWHILQVQGRRKYDISDENAQEQAYRYLHQRKYQEELEAWLQKIRDEAYVEIKT